MAWPSFEYGLMHGYPMFAKSKVNTRLIPLSEEQIPLIRYALGTSLIMIVAMSVAWDLAFLTPVLSLSFFAPGTKMPSFRQGFGFILTIAVTIMIGYVLTRFFIDFKWFFIPVLAYALFWVFYTNKIAGTAKAFMLIALLLIPMLGIQNISLAYGFSLAFISGAAISIFMVWLVFTLIPDHVNPNIEQLSQAENKKDGPTEQQRLAYAFGTLLIVFPAVLFFFFFEWLGGLLILIFIVLLSMNPAFTFKAGMMIIKGNLLGGLFAILAYELLVWVPEYPFFIILTLSAGLFFALQLFSKKPTAALYGMGYSTFLLIIGQTTTSTDDAGGKVWVRIVQMLVAVSYVVIAFAIQNAYREKRIRKQMKQN